MTRTNDIQQLYIGLLGRAADAGGLNYWANSEYSIDEIAARIVHGADEFPQDDRPALIAQLFDNLFNRTATPDDVAYWEGWLDQYDASLDVLVMNLIRYPSEQDGETLNNRTFVANAYTKAAAGTDKELDLEAAAAVIDDVNHTPLSVSEALATIDGAAGDPTDLLAQLQAANDNLNAVVKAWGDAAGVENATAAHVAAAVEATEAKLGAYVTDNAGLLFRAGTDVPAYNVDEDGLAQLGSQDAVEDARLNLIQTEVAAQAAALNKRVQDTTKALNDVDSGLKVLVDSYLRAAGSIESAIKAQNVATASLYAAGQDFFVANSAQLDWVKAEADSSSASIQLVLVTGEDYLQTFDADTGKWTTEVWDVDAEEYVPATPGALAAFDLDALRDLAEDTVAAHQAVGSAEELKQQRLESLAKADAEQTNATFDGDELLSVDDLDGEAAAYVEAQSALNSFTQLRAGLDKLVADVEAMRDVGATVVELDKAAKAASKDLTDAGFAVETLVDGDGYDATTKDDVILLGDFEAGQSAIVYDFGFAGNDVIYVGDAYTLNTGKFADDGDNSVLELFLKQTGANTVIQFEVDPFSSATNVNQSFEITLTGVNVEDVAFVDGFISVA